MSKTTVLQVRLDPKIKSRAGKYAESLGYSSLQEVVRVFLNSFALKEVKPSIVAFTTQTEQFPPEHINLSDKAKREWAQTLKDANRNKNMYSFNDPREALDFLLTDKRKS